MKCDLAWRGMNLFHQLAARAILKPWKLPWAPRPKLAHRETSFEGEGGVTLKGWVIGPAAEGAEAPAGWLVYLHGWGANRFHAGRVARAFVPRGYSVLAYDSRAHGRSGGAHCTYGWLEKRDLTRALDAHGIGSTLVLGTSLGGAVALQAAPNEPRLRGVIAHAPFVDLRAAIADRSRLFPRAVVEGGIAAAEAEVGFKVEDVSPLLAAPGVKAPVLLLHGAKDPWTPPWHSERILAALAGPKELYRVPGASHDDVMWNVDAWSRLLEWSDALAPLPRAEEGQ